MSTDTREALAALMVIAAECAQRKPLRGFEELTEAIHIGHRQFGRAHEKADEDVRMLAVRLRAVFDTLAAALATQPAQPSAQGEAVAWLVEWKADGYGPQWWGFNSTPGKNGTWCSDANNAIRFARKEDAERMRLHIIAVAGLTGMHDYERSVSVTEHMWVGPRRAE